MAPVCRCKNENHAKKTTQVHSKFIASTNTRSKRSAERKHLLGCFFRLPRTAVHLSVCIILSFKHLLKWKTPKISGLGVVCVTPDQDTAVLNKARLCHANAASFSNVVPESLVSALEEP